MHLPVAVSSDGKKLSKRDKTDPVRQQDPAFAIHQALCFLGQKPPHGLALDELWRWAFEHWDAALIPRQKQIKPSKV